MKKLRKSITAAIAIGVLTVSMTVTAVAAGNLKHGSYYDGWCGYKAGFSYTNTVYYPQKHRTWARVGLFSSSVKIGYRYTQTDVVSGFGSFSHGCKVEY